jgi:IclR family KDG regulon transcriptional repressor
MAENTNDTSGVAAAERTMLILEHLSQHDYINLEDLSKECDLPKATLYRFLQTLTNLGYIRRRDDDKYSLTLRMFSVGSNSLGHSDLITIARPVAEELSRITGETVHIGILEKTRAVYVLKIESSHTIRMYSRLGKHIPLYCTAIGKLFLSEMNTEDFNAYLSEVMKNKTELKRYTPKTLVTKKTLLEELKEVKSLGYARDKEEHEEGITCLGAPIYDLDGNIAAAISVSFPLFRFDATRLEEYAQAVKNAGEEISRNFGYND